LISKYRIDIEIKDGKPEQEREKDAYQNRGSRSKLRIEIG
jgi:hypothetical protein